MFYVYRHIRLDSCTPFYVGKGQGKRAYDLDKRNFYHSNITSKFPIKVELVRHFIKEAAAYAFEELLITLYKAYGYCEANMTTGGKGGSKGRLVKDETRLKLSKAALGSKRTLETKIKMGLAQTGIKNHRWGKPLSKERKELLRKFNTGKVMSPEARRKISLNTSMSKNVICIETKTEWNSCADAARALGLNYNTLRGKLNGSLKNNTTLRYKETSK